MNPSLEARQESWQAALPELNRLFPLHWAEVEQKFPLEMNYHAYRGLEASGTLLLCTLRQEGELVGYWTCVMVPFLHSRSLRAAMTDLVFVHKDFRAGGAFFLLQAKMEELLRSKGTALWFAGEKLAKPIGAALQRAGFAPEEMVYLKRLGA